MTTPIKPARTRPRKKGRIYCAHCDVYFGESEIPAARIVRTMFMIDGELICLNCLEFGWLYYKEQHPKEQPQ